MGSEEIAIGERGAESILNLCAIKGTKTIKLALIIMALWDLVGYRQM
jgi:hypothetical protein